MKGRNRKYPRGLFERTLKLWPNVDIGRGMMPQKEEEVGKLPLVLFGVVLLQPRVHGRVQPDGKEQEKAIIVSLKVRKVRTVRTARRVKREEGE